MTAVWARLDEALAAKSRAALVTLAAVAGSSPREAGARMVVRADGSFWGSIGGGALEWEVLAQARSMLATPDGPVLRRDWPLGPELGQCCGGRVTTWTEIFTAADRPAIAALAARERDGPFELWAWIGPDRQVQRSPDPQAGALCERHGEAFYPVWLFGAGHVGRALALALAPLPVRLTWIDGRDAAFPTHSPANARTLCLADPAAALATAPEDAAVLVMTHSHALDLAVVAAALRRSGDAPVGLIGSATKRARFLARLNAAGLGEAAAVRLVCPIGVPGIAGKEPAIIAAATAAQVLQWRDAAAACRVPEHTRRSLGSRP